MYEQLKKNTVSAENQLKNSNIVQYYNQNGKGKKILIAGNSITFHGYKEEIGWLGSWGMAASAPEKDYVHILMEKIKEIEPDAVFCIFQVSSWEANYKDPTKSYENFDKVEDFNQDITIVRIVENCPHSTFDGEIFKSEYAKMLKRLAKDSELIITDGFWRHPGDGLIKEVADENGYRFVPLGDLGDNPEMKAIGLFRHGGVAAHPGDKGMVAIADRIFEKVNEIL